MEINFDTVKRIEKLEDINPMNLPNGVMYPDTGGHTGFFLKSYGISMLYGRFFVFAIIYKEINIQMKSSQTIIDVFSKWKEIMDKVISKEQELISNPNTKGIHVSQVFFKEDESKLQQGLF